MSVRVENTSSGWKVIRADSGQQRLFVAAPQRRELILLSTLAEVIAVRRHWVNDIQMTEPCWCEPRCHTSRLDRMIACLLAGPDRIAEERIFICPEIGFAALQRSMVAKHLDHSDLAGLHVIVQRTGPKCNGRVSVEVQSRMMDAPKTFDLVAGVRGSMGIAADFFRSVDEEDLPERKTLPARTREEKPRVALGADQQKRR